MRWTYKTWLKARLYSVPQNRVRRVTPHLVLSGCVCGGSKLMCLYSSSWDKIHNLLTEVSYCFKSSRIDIIALSCHTTMITCCHCSLCFSHISKEEVASLSTATMQIFVSLLIIIHPLFFWHNEHATKKKMARISSFISRLIWKSVIPSNKYLVVKNYSAIWMIMSFFTPSSLTHTSHCPPSVRD